MTSPIDNHLRPANARRRLAAASASGLVLLAASAAPGVGWAAETRVFRLPAEPLEAALVRFAVQGGVSVGGLPVAGCSGRSRPVSGALPPSQALGALLPAGCGFEMLDAKSFRIVARPFAAPVAAAGSGASETAPSPRLDELVVTAEKRPELLSHTASAISVLSATDVDALGGRSFDEVASQAVGVAVTNL
ncbi:MAG TPA: hypothetical protein VHS75_14785, partial [Phenylobacterium sp.]|nr:hypothetical protein [Phenylobacterium sp.]